MALQRLIDRSLEEDHTGLVSFLTSEVLLHARAEVVRSSCEQIEFETAQKWAARAVACYEIYLRTLNVAWLIRATGYYHEALEHGAFAGAGTVDLVRAELGPMLEVERWV